MSDMNMEQKRGKKTGLLVAIIAAVAVIAVIAVLFLADPFKWFGRKAALDKWLKVFYVGEDIAEPEDLYPEAVLDYFEENGNSLVDEWSEGIEQNREYMEEAYGKDVKVSYKVTEEEKLDDGDLKDVAEMLEEQYGLDADSVKKGYWMQFDLTVKGSEEEEEVEDAEILALKIDGKWYVANVMVEDGDYVYVGFAD